MPETSTSERRRNTGDNHIISLVVKFVGWPVVILAIALASSLLITVAYMAIEKKEPPGFTPLITSVAGALGVGLGYIGGLLSNARSNAPTPGEIGKSIVDEAAKANGLAVDVQTPDPAQDEIARLQAEIADLKSKLEPVADTTKENLDESSSAN